jgi:hypothetical protein
MNKRLPLGAAIAAAGLFAVPSFAGAATTCSLDTTNRQVNIQLANPGRSPTRTAAGNTSSSHS